MVGLMSEHFDAEEPPEPEFVVICSSALEWKEQARKVAAFAKSVLLVGTNDRRFIEELSERFQMQFRIDELRGTAMVWDATGFEGRGRIENGAALSSRT